MKQEINEDYLAALGEMEDSVRDMMRTERPDKMPSWAYKQGISLLRTAASALEEARQYLREREAT